LAGRSCRRRACTASSPPHCRQPHRGRPDASLPQAQTAGRSSCAPAGSVSLRLSSGGLGAAFSCRRCCGLAAQGGTWCPRRTRCPLGR
jgi:hypothetical protein